MKNKGWVWVAVVFFVVLNGCVIKFDKGTTLKNPIKRESLKLNHEGDLLLKKGEHSLALKKFDEAIKIDPNNDYAYNNRGLVYNFTGKYDKAIKEYDKAISINPNNPIYYNNKAYPYLLFDKPEEAILLCEKAISMNPKLYYAYGHRMLAYILLGQYDEAEKDLGKLQELNPQPFLVEAGRGVIEYHKGNHEKAMECLKKAHHMEFKDSYTIMYLGKCYDAMGNTQEALYFYKKYLEVIEPRSEEEKASPLIKSHIKDVKDRIKELEVEEK